MSKISKSGYILVTLITGVLTAVGRGSVLRVRVHVFLMGRSGGLHAREVRQTLRPSSPMAEAGDLKSSQCGFESHLGHLSAQALIGAEVEVLVQAAAWIERRRTGRTSVHVEVLPNRQGLRTDAAEDCVGAPFAHRPHLGFMISRFNVAEVAWVELAAAFEPDGDDVELCAVVNAPGLMIDRRSQHPHSASNGAA